MIYKEGDTLLDIVHCKNCDLEILKEFAPLCRECMLQKKQMNKIYWFFSHHCAPCVKCRKPVEKIPQYILNYRSKKTVVYTCSDCKYYRPLTESRILTVDAPLLSNASLK